MTYILDKPEFSSTKENLIESITILKHFVFSHLMGLSYWDIIDPSKGQVYKSVVGRSKSGILYNLFSKNCIFFANFMFSCAQFVIALKWSSSPLTLERFKNNSRFEKKLPKSKVESNDPGTIYKEYPITCVGQFLTYPRHTYQ